MPFLCLLFSVCSRWLASHVHSLCSLPRVVLGSLPVRVRTFAFFFFLTYHVFIFFKPRIRHVDSLQLKYYLYCQFFFFNFEKEYSLTCSVDHPISEDGDAEWCVTSSKIVFSITLCYVERLRLYLLMGSDVFKSIVIQHFVVRFVPHGNHLRESVLWYPREALIPWCMHQPLKVLIKCYSLHLFSYQICMCGAHVWRSGQCEGVTLFLSLCGFWAST